MRRLHFMDLVSELGGDEARKQMDTLTADANRESDVDVTVDTQSYQGVASEDEINAGGGGGTLGRVVDMPNKSYGGGSDDDGGGGGGGGGGSSSSRKTAQSAVDDDDMGTIQVPIQVNFRMCCDRVGKQPLLCAVGGVYGKRFPAHCLVGPDWPCLMYTYSLILVPSVLFFIFVASRFHIAVVISGAVTSVWAVGSLSMAACSDPGIVPARSRDLPPPEPEAGCSICMRCNVVRPRGAIHCHDCGVCVMDVRV